MFYGIYISVGNVLLITGLVFWAIWALACMLKYFWDYSQGEDMNVAVQEWNSLGVVLGKIPVGSRDRSLTDYILLCLCLATAVLLTPLMWPVALPVLLIWSVAHHRRRKIIRLKQCQEMMES